MLTDDLNIEALADFSHALNNGEYWAVHRVRAVIAPVLPRLLAVARLARELEAEVRKAKADGLLEAARIVEKCRPSRGVVGYEVLDEQFRLMIEIITDEAERDGRKKGT